MHPVCFIEVKKCHPTRTLTVTSAWTLGRYQGSYAVACEGRLNTELLSQRWLRLEPAPLFFVYKGTVKSSQFRPTPKPTQFRRSHRTWAIYGPHRKNQFNFDHPHKKISQSITTLKISQFRPAHSHSHFRPPRTKNKSNSIPHTKINLISTPSLNQVKRIPTLKSGQFWCPDTKTQVNLDPGTTTLHSFTHTQKPSQIRSKHWNQVKFNPSHWN